MSLTRPSYCRGPDVSAYLVYVSTYHIIPGLLLRQAYMNLFLRRVEAAVIISAACIPVLHPLYEQILNNLRRVLCGRGNMREEEGAEVESVPPRQNDDVGGGFWTRKMRLAMASVGGTGISSLSTSTTTGTGTMVSSLSPEREVPPLMAFSSKQPPMTTTDIEVTSTTSRMVVSEDSGTAGTSNFERTRGHGNGVSGVDFITTPASLKLPSIKEAHVRTGQHH